MNMKLLRTSILACSFAAAFVAGCKRHDESKADGPALPAAAVRVQVIEAKKRVATEEVVATVRPKLQARLEAKVAGRIEQMRAVPGQPVKAGELLVRLDVQEIRARLDQAAAVQQQAESELKRTTALLEHSSATRSEFDAVQARARVAAAAVKEAEAMLGYAEIVAPFDGVVTRKLADVGDLAAPGKPLVELEDPSALRLEADVPEALIGRVRLEDKLPVRGATTLTGLEGVVSEIAPAADSASRTFLVKLDLPPATPLRSGQFARVAVPVGETSALRVAASAVVQRGQMELVFVETNRIAQLRLVKTGRRVGGEVELVSGVAAGERVVTEGAAQLRDGQPVEIRP